MKPTFGLISHFGLGFGWDQSIDHTGPMPRTVKDAATALQATAGYDAYDPRQGRGVPDLILGELARKNYAARVYAKAQNVRPTFVKAYDDTLSEVDVLVMPTSMTTAPENHRPDTLAQAVEENLAHFRRVSNTGQFNYTGHPALAVPVGKSSNGLPLSMQLVGRFFDDPLVMRTAYAYEQSVHWDLTPTL